MELFRSELYYIFVRKESSLWWNRLTGAFSVRSAWDLSDIEDIECLGITEGIIGKVEHSNVYEPRLMIIKESVPVGQIYFHHTIYKIKSICFLNMGAANQEVELSACTKHNSSSSVASNKLMNKKMGGRLFEKSAFLNKTVGAVKTVSNTIKTTTQQAATQVKQSVQKQRDPKVAERLEKRITDELYKIFEDSDSFYYSRTLDLTNSLQRQYEVEKLLEAEAETKPVSDITRWWKHVDDRFFWNKHMLKDIISLGSPDCDQWVLPIIQGYVQLAQIPVETAENNPLNTESLSSTNSCDETFTIGVISRRSRFQAGTRYNRRGIDERGKVANYVETEQIVSIICSDCVHRASFVQVRGSVPIFWSQPDYKFRPPPRLDRTEDESHEAFKTHFSEELTLYKQVCIVNLVEQQGRERIIWEAYGNHVLKYNSPDIIYATFDFHEYCRGMHYENVSILINAIADIIGEMRFCWRDDRGLICSQAGVFRVNCIDCLDRTNVVQTAIAKYVVELQLCRLGLGTPGAGLAGRLRAAFLAMWADNGDVISRQYAGTKALKGDYTRTGERKFSGMMKDGVASANRYYLSTFKDAVRQVAIDSMTGSAASLPQQLMTATTECAPCLSVKDDHPLDTEAMAQHVKSLIDDCKKLIVDTEPVLGSWGLIDADPQSIFRKRTARFRPHFANLKHQSNLASAGPSLHNAIEHNENIFDLIFGDNSENLDTLEAKIPEAVLDPPSNTSTNNASQSLTTESHETLFNVFSDLVFDLMDDGGQNNENVNSDEFTYGPSMYAVWERLDSMVEKYNLNRYLSPFVDLCTGDPQETEMDTVLLLTNEAYYAADYDETSDRILSVTRVPLRDVTAIELGAHDTNTHIFNVGRKSATEPVVCIRIAYVCGGEPGYFHMFRSTSLRFFNNMAVAINTRDEMIESLHSICETILVARDVAKLPPIPFHDGVKLERKKSKVHPVQGQSSAGRSSLYLDLSRLPTLTKNVSETQLVADIRSVGSKALNNMSEQFSKLNKLSHSLNARARPSLQLRFDQGTSQTKKIFTLGSKSDKKKGSLSDGMSSDYSSDDENRTNIFEPTLDNFENTQHYIGKSNTKTDTENDCELIENPLYSSKIEPSENQENQESIPLELVSTSEKQTLKTPSNIRKTNPFDAESKTPEIQVDSKPLPPNSLVLTQKLSHSSSDINYDENPASDVNYHRSNSQHEITLNIAQSHSESALRQFKNMASPVSTATRDMVLSPLSKLAKGVQTLGANLDPRKMKSAPAVKHISETQYEEHRKLQEKWRDCNTRLVAL